MDDYKAWFTVQCWGCNKSETRGYHDQKEVDYQTDLLKLQGWRRRIFGNNINASPWFCSEDCAMNSYNAKRAEEWWARHDARVADEKRIVPMQFWPIIIFAGVLSLMALLASWCH